MPKAERIVKWAELAGWYGSKSLFPWMDVWMLNWPSRNAKAIAIPLSGNLTLLHSIPLLYISSSFHLYWVEVNVRTTKEIAESNDEIVPPDGRIAKPEGCFDPSETFKSHRWPSQLWMIAKRCKLSCSKSTSGERERVFDLFCRKFEVLFSALGRNYFQSLLLHHLSSMTFFNHDFKKELLFWLLYQLTLTYQQTARKGTELFWQLCKYVAFLLWGWLGLTFTLEN